MLSHKRIWTAIDRIAKEAGLTPSGLAKKAGLDPTSFNKSKRTGSGGKLRWPSTESLYKVLKSLGKDLSYFSALVEPDSFSEIKIIGNIKNTFQGFSENSETNELDIVNFPRTFSKDTVAIKIEGYSLDPIYRNGDVIIVNPKDSFISKDDRIAIKTTDGEILIKQFSKKDDKDLTVKSLDKDSAKSKIPTEKIEWIARIIWVSQ